MRLTVDNVAQIANADIDFGDLTILVGAQGTGKTIFLQLLKFCVDMEYIKDTMNDFGQTWDCILQAPNPQNCKENSPPLPGEI